MGPLPLMFIWIRVKNILSYKDLRVMVLKGAFPIPSTRILLQLRIQEAFPAEYVYPSQSVSFLTMMPMLLH